MEASCLFPGSSNQKIAKTSKDIVFLSNPFPHFFGDSDLEAMTDHFFPQKHLWATWLRPAEHINTGFLLAKPSVKLFVPWRIWTSKTGFEKKPERHGWSCFFCIHHCTVWLGWHFLLLGECMKSVGWRCSIPFSKGIYPLLGSRLTFERLTMNTFKTKVTTRLVRYNIHIKYPYHPWDCYIYLHEWLVFMV